MITVMRMNLSNLSSFLAEMYQHYDTENDKDAQNEENTNHSKKH